MYGPWVSQVPLLPLKGAMQATSFSNVALNSVYVDLILLVGSGDFSPPAAPSILDGVNAII